MGRFSKLLQPTQVQTQTEKQPTPPPLANLNEGFKVVSSHEQHNPSTLEVVHAQNQHTPKRRGDDTTTRRSDEATRRRKIKRQTMDYYADQIELLSIFSLQEKLKGRNISISFMLREALDAYIQRKNLRALVKQDQ